MAVKERAAARDAAHHRPHRTITPLRGDGDRGGMSAQLGGEAAGGLVRHTIGGHTFEVDARYTDLRVIGAGAYVSG